MTQIIAGVRLRLVPNLYRFFLFASLLVYSITFIHLAFALHAGMRTHKADLGQIAQAVWNSSRGRFVEMTDNGFVATRLTDHVEPILALISPVLWVWDDVRALLLVQVLAVALGAVFVYALTMSHLAKVLSFGCAENRSFPYGVCREANSASHSEQTLTVRKKGQSWQVVQAQQRAQPGALALAVAYLLTPQLQSALLTEFHAAPLAVPLILWAFWAVEARRVGHFVAAALLVAGVKEEMALLAAGLGVWAIWRFWICDCGNFDFAQYRFWIGEEGSTGYSGIEKNEEENENERTSHYLVTVSLCLLVTILSLVWFYVATFVIVPRHAVGVYGVAESGYFTRYGALGDSPADILKSFVTQPGVVWRIAVEPARVAYLLGLLAPFGFLALLAPEVLLLSLPVFLANLLSAYPPQFYGDFHYSAPLVPYVAVASSLGAGRLWRWMTQRACGVSATYQQRPAAHATRLNLVTFMRSGRATVRPLVTALLVLWVAGWALITYQDAGRGPGGGRYDPTPLTEHHRLLPRFLAQIPRDAAVTATAAVHPHLAHRRYVFQFPIGLDESALTAPGFATASAPTWALIDVTTNTDMAPGDVKVHVDAMLAGDWGIVDGADGFLLLRRGATVKEIPNPFYDFVRKTDHIEASLSGEEHRPLEFLKTQVQDWPRWRQTKISATWRIGEEFDPIRHRPVLELRRPNGELLYELATIAPPALVWYPPERWRAGEVVKITTLGMFLPSRWGVVVNESAAPRVADIFVRGPDEQLRRLDLLRTTANGNNPSLVALIEGADPAATATFRLADGRQLGLRAWIVDSRSWPGGQLNLLLDWQGKDKDRLIWPPEYHAFIHARLAGKNVTQSDGRPRFFVPAERYQPIGPSGHAWDWRLVPLPETLSAGNNVLIVIGLYNPSSGARADVVNADGVVLGNEVVVDEAEIRARPVADQACALIPASCDGRGY